MSTLPAGYRILPIDEGRVEEFRDVDALAFADSADDAARALVPFPIPLDRAMVVERPDGTVAAAHGSYPFTLPVPGGRVPCAGLTWVGVRPDERRRGLLRAMIDMHFRRSLDRGEPVSALWAAEPAIYGRFGYGAACDEVRLRLPRGAALRPVEGSDRLRIRLERADVDAHADLVAAVNDAVDRPGWITRSTPTLRQGAVLDPPHWREGAERLLLAIVLGPDDEVRGYATFRRKDSWTAAGTPRSVVVVRQAVALDAAATHRLWSFLLDLDLTAVVEVGHLAIDHPLLCLLVDRRAAEPAISDNLWVRLLDVPAALAARRYVADLDLVVELTDAQLPANAGRWHLATGAPDDAGLHPLTATRSDAEPDLRLDVRELGAAYLGAGTLSAASAAGLVEERTPGAVFALATAFGWPVAPVCGWIF